MPGIHYFVVRVHRGWDHDDDKWLGIFDDPEDAKRCLGEAMIELKREREEKNRSLMEKRPWALEIPEDIEEIMINRFDENVNEWSFDVCPEEL